MSQGEVNALALSVFLPRATPPLASPFRFLVIDDPVQAMDPAKVDGLARVLERTAADRQAIVFTHDNRLAQAVRQLSIPAAILEVTRRPGSAVQVRTCLDPVDQALETPVALAATNRCRRGRCTCRSRVVPHRRGGRVHRGGLAPGAARRGEGTPKSRMIWRPPVHASTFLPPLRLPA